MAQLITLAIDIALGALAYRLAYENRARITAFETKLNKVIDYLKKAGLLDLDDN
jgi:uncharacterized membrane-anchored protein YhcB (DUF1043 family)